jgi:hypothetical protein
MHYLEYQAASLSGNTRWQQFEIEKMVIIRTGIRVARENAANANLFRLPQNV